MDRLHASCLRVGLGASVQLHPGRAIGFADDLQVAPAQLEALAKWGAPRADAFDYLRAITQPTLVINGSNDVLVYTVNSLFLQQNLPNAQLILYPDSNHGSQYQYPTLFIADVTRFLDAEVPFPIQKD